MSKVYRCFRCGEETPDTAEHECRAMPAQDGEAAAVEQRDEQLANGAKGIKPGDWVRFYRNGVLLIADVVYVRQQEMYPRAWYAYTDAGMVHVADVIEVRHG